MRSSLEIAQAATLRPIADVAEEAGIERDELELYGRYKAKVDLSILDRLADRSDGKIGHLDGVNLSRAWCWRSLAAAWPPEDPCVALAHETADRHLSASLPHIAGDYAGEHWLATYALLALTA